MSVQIGLSTASVYPQNTESAFRFAAELGYDGIELMVWADPVSQNPDAVASLSRRYSMPVLALHAPCLLITQRVWGSDPITRLTRSAEVSERLGSEAVVIHPPFRWQRRYVDGFADQVAELEDDTGVAIAVENMFPMRIDRFFGPADAAADRLRRRGGPGPGLSAFAPTYDPTDRGHTHYTLDFSHVATAGTDVHAMVDRMGSGLTHLHLADGRGAAIDEHLIPGDGTAPVAEICDLLTERGWRGRAVVEINTQNARTVRERAAMLTRALDFARAHLPGHPPTIGERP